MANVQGWRSGRVDGFKEVEEFLRDNGDDYYEQVSEYFARKSAMFDFGAMQIASKILKWDELTDREKGRVWTAYVFLKNNAKKNVGDTDYETKLLKARKYGSNALYDELKKIDPKASRKIHPNDVRRIIRTLEIYYSTGIPVSEHKKNTKGIKDEYEIIEAGLNIPRGKLYDKINTRVEGMFREGLVSEVKRLLRRKLSITAK